MSNTVRHYCVLLLLLLACAWIPAMGQERESAREIEELRKQVEDLKRSNRDFEHKLQALEDRLKKTSTTAVPTQQTSEAEAEADKLLGEPTATPLLSYQISPNTSVQLVDLSLDVMTVGGMSTVEDKEIQMLQAGGHDPKRRGFTLQQVELSAQGAIDPYVRGYIHMVYLLNAENESQFELEEAYLVTQTLPWGLQAKAGHFLTSFGRINPSHPHAWDFVDQPVILSRIFGPDGLRNPGLQMSWVPDLPWHSELVGSIQNAAGGTAVSFLSRMEAEENFGEAFAGHPFIDREVMSPRDIAYLARWANTVEIMDELSCQLGYSFLYGPNNTGRNADTYIHGWDIFLKWRPRQTDYGFPFVTWQTEFVLRRYEAEASDTMPHEMLDDWGWYSQLCWGFLRSWVAAVRYDFARGDRGQEARDFLRNERHRVAAALTWYPSEFLRLRTQYNWDKAQHLGSSPEHSLWLQVEFLLGSHGAHKF